MSHVTLIPNYAGPSSGDKYKIMNGWTRDKIVNHIKANFKGISKIDHPQFPGNSMCVYRGPSDKKCGVGIFIPENKYSATFEGKSVLSLEVSALEDIFPLELAGMEALQLAHDKTEDDDLALSRMLNIIENHTVE